MNQNQTIQKMKSMRLQGMAEAHYTALQSNFEESYTTDQYLNLLVEREWEHRQNRKITNLIKKAAFRTSADVRNVDFTVSRGLDKNVFDRLAGLDFLAKNENIILTGATGTGKSFLAQAIGHQACFCLFKTQYYTMAQFTEAVNLAKLQGTYHKLIKGINRTDLLIIDDFGLTPLQANTRNAIMDIAEHKYDRSSIIIASQIPVANWHELFGEATIADAILDRIVHAAHRIQLNGQSLRKKRTVNQN